LSVEIDNEILIVHKVSSLTPQHVRARAHEGMAQFMQDHYTTRFPELASLVSQPIPFCRVVLALGNAEELRGNLAGILASGAVMAVQVTAATSKGEVLDDKEWGIVEDAATMMFGLDDSKRKVSTPCLSRRYARTDKVVFRSWSTSSLESRS
jgi:U4/U6 small nuclear ribonucleoprotein PRP31